MVFVLPPESIGAAHNGLSARAVSFLRHRRLCQPHSMTSAEGIFRHVGSYVESVRYQ